MHLEWVLGKDAKMIILLVITKPTLLHMHECFSANATKTMQPRKFCLCTERFVR